MYKRKLQQFNIQVVLGPKIHTLTDLFDLQLLVDG